MALRLGRLFMLAPGFWLKLQARVDLDEAERKLGPALQKIRPLV